MVIEHPRLLLSWLRRGTALALASNRSVSQPRPYPRGDALAVMRKVGSG
jgi:hypothetical protein